MSLKSTAEENSDEIDRLFMAMWTLAAPQGMSFRAKPIYRKDEGWPDWRVAYSVDVPGAIRCEITYISIPRLRDELPYLVTNLKRIRSVCTKAVGELDASLEKQI